MAGTAPPLLFQHKLSRQGETKSFELKRPRFECLDFSGLDIVDGLELRMKVPNDWGRSPFLSM